MHLPVKHTTCRYEKLREDEAISQVVAAEFRARTRSTNMGKLQKEDSWLKYESLPLYCSRRS